MSCTTSLPNQIFCVSGTTIPLLQNQDHRLLQNLCFRARAYACSRQWKKAIADYEAVLSWYPDNEAALAGMADVMVPYEDLPMIDKDMVSNASLFPS